MEPKRGPDVGAPTVRPIKPLYLLMPAVGLGVLGAVGDRDEAAAGHAEDQERTGPGVCCWSVDHTAYIPVGDRLN
jgi:hypothetical protein